MPSFARSTGCLLLVFAGCAHAVPRPEAEPLASACGDARAVRLTEEASAGPVFRRLGGAHQAKLTFACPSEQSCSLPEDTQIVLTLQPVREVACEFAACRVPYLGNLPFSEAGSDPCPAVLWSVYDVTLRTDAQTLDTRESEVNVLSSRQGEAYLRFMIENPAALSHDGAQPAAAQTSLLDVQLEVHGSQVRGQLSALSAPLPSEPASELRFKAVWTATWESTLAP